MRTQLVHGIFFVCGVIAGVFLTSFIALLAIRRIGFVSIALAQDIIKIVAWNLMLSGPSYVGSLGALDRKKKKYQLSGNYGWSIAVGYVTGLARISHHRARVGAAGKV